MSARDDHVQWIKQGGIVAVVRAAESAQLVQVVEAISKGGIRSIEITLTTPGALEVIRTCAERFRGRVLIGAGTVLDPETARAAILVGAEYIVAPALNPEVIALCRRYGKVVIPGALTPTEILSAWERGADIVKVFPATAFGPRYFRDIKGPLPHIDLLPTGGVSLENAADFIQAGACAIAVGSNLVREKAVTEGRFDAITEIAKQFVDAVQTARKAVS